MSEKTYEFPGDYVLEVLNVANETRPTEALFETGVAQYRGWLS